MTKVFSPFSRTQISSRVQPSGADAIRTRTVEPNHEAPVASISIREFTVLKKLASGAMGTVYLGMKADSLEPVAIKLLRLSPDDSSSRRARFQREWDVISRLQHPNIVGGISFQIFGNTCCIVMEYENGPDLQTLVQQQGPLTPQLAAQLNKTTPESVRVK